MELMEAIRGRCSVGRVLPDPVPRHLIENVLEAATWAPSHHRTEPWKFFVLTGEGRRSLGRTLAEIAAAEMEDPNSEASREKLRQAEAKAFRAPVIIVAAMAPSDKPGVLRIEEIAAVSAAIQNLLLAAHDAGLGAVWRTGNQAYHPAMKRLFGLREQDEVLGFIYLGYPDINLPPRRRIPFPEKTVWIEE